MVLEPLSSNEETKDAEANEAQRKYCKEMLKKDSILTTSVDRSLGKKAFTAGAEKLLWLTDTEKLCSTMSTAQQWLNDLKQGERMNSSGQHTIGPLGLGSSRTCVQIWVQ